ncbi:MAG: Vms1/Ankzf1 family peptidyl-tRNA hydrolase [Trueperaceae bacterium]
MFHKIDLEALAERSGPERAFLSLYLAGPDSLDSLDARIKKVRGLLEENADEAEHFEENLKLVNEFLADYDFTSGSLAIFSCWALEFLQAYSIEKEVPDLLWVDSSPYIRPLAELQDKYQNFVVVLADNSETHVYLVTSARPQEQETVKGNIKNHVRKGGWSQKRYARRRENALDHYAKEVVAVLEELDKRREFEYIVLAGSDETMNAIRGELPQSLAEKLAGAESVDLHQDDETWDSVFEMFFEEGRQHGRDLWNLIKAESLRSGRAALGPQEVLEAAAVGRVDRMLVTRDARIAGKRCRECENLLADVQGDCPVCQSDSLFTVDLVEELVELMLLSNAEPEFTDAIGGLSKSGDVAALLRY